MPIDHTSQKTLILIDLRSLVIAKGFKKEKFKVVENKVFLNDIFYMKNVIEGKLPQEINIQEVLEFAFFLGEDEFKNNSLPVGPNNLKYKIPLNLIIDAYKEHFKSLNFDNTSSFDKENFLLFKNTGNNSLLLDKSRIDDFGQRLIIITGDNGLVKLAKKQIGEDIVHIPCYKDGQFDINDLTCLNNALENQSKNEFNYSRAIVHLDIDNTTHLEYYTRKLQTPIINDQIKSLDEMLTKSFSTNLTYEMLSARTDPYKTIEQLKQLHIKSLYKETKNLTEKEMQSCENAISGPSGIKTIINSVEEKYQIKIHHFDHGFTGGKSILKASVIDQQIKKEEENEANLRIFVDDNTNEIGWARLLAMNSKTTQLFVIQVHAEGDMEENAAEIMAEFILENFKKAQESRNDELQDSKDSAENPFSFFPYPLLCRNEKGSIEQKTEKTEQEAIRLETA